MKLLALLLLIGASAEPRQVVLGFTCPNREATLAFLNGVEVRACQVLFGLDTSQRLATVLEVTDTIKFNGRFINIGRLNYNGREVYSAGQLTEELLS